MSKKKQRKFNQFPPTRSKAIASYLVSVIIPVYGRYDILQKCLDAIPDAFGEITHEIVIVDDGSPPEEKKAFYANAVLPPNTKIIDVKTHGGFSSACNRGARASFGALLFFLNGDVILSKDSGKKLVKEMDNPAIGVAGMKLLFPNEQQLTEANLKFSAVQRAPGRVQHVGLFTNVRGEVFHMYLGWSADNPRVNAVREAYAVTGAALMTRKSLYKELGGFNEIYGLGSYEDVEYCLLVREKGLSIVVNTSAVGIHYTGATAEKYGGYPLHQNRIIFEQRWYNKLKYTEWLYH